MLNRAPGDGGYTLFPGGGLGVNILTIVSHLCILVFCYFKFTADLLPIFGVVKVMMQASEGFWVILGKFTADFIFISVDFF